VLTRRISKAYTNKRISGFSMIEMMFAIMICTIVLLGLLGVLGSVLRNQAEGRVYEKVSIAANSIFGQAGQALSEDFDRPLVPAVFADGRQPVTNLDDVEFEISQTLERDDLMRVDIVIHWADEKDVAHSKPMMTKFLKEK
jgi:type II secretory pathway pseudopilin PulG